VLRQCARGWVTDDLLRVVRFLGGLPSVSVPSLVRVPRCWAPLITDPHISCYLYYERGAESNNLAKEEIKDRLYVSFACLKICQPRLYRRYHGEPIPRNMRREAGVGLIGVPRHFMHL